MRNFLLSLVCTMALSMFAVGCGSSHGGGGGGGGGSPPPPPPSGVTVTTTTLPGAADGQSYSTGLTATGGTSPYTWSIVSGSLPQNLVLSASGTISGNVTATGNFSFIVQVQDSGGHSAQSTLALSATNPVTVSPSLLPDATVNTNYNVPLSASGGSPPYTWSINGGTLPGGITLNASTGVLSGTPTASGVFNFTVEAHTPSASANVGYTLTIH